MRPQIAYLTTGDPSDRRSWSGIDYHMSRALSRHFGDVLPITGVQPRVRLTLGRAINVAARVFGKRYAYLHSFLLARGCARIAAGKLDKVRADLLFLPSASTIGAFLPTKLPTVYLSGATFALMESYYPQYQNLLPRSAREGHAIEQAMIERARLLLYPTDWPARSAVGRYGADPAKIRIIPYGANLEPGEIPTREMLGARSDACRLLFLGVDWNRKGGEIAYDALVELDSQGFPCELTVCGCTPPVRHPRMRVIPFLDKNDPRRREELCSLFTEADFLLLPTRNECFGVVFCEASAFGVPSISTATGGVPGVVRNGENGFLLPLNAGGREYARVVRELWEDEERYRSLSASSRDAFEKRLNWDAWGRETARALRGVL
ncbi:MAG: glycosyltransferase family 4 protein [Armatimonadota bacterium]